MVRTYRNVWAAFILLSTFLLLTIGRPADAAPELTVGNYELVSSKRITRTVFEYTYKAAVTNNTGIDVTEVSATVSINSPGITVIDNYLEFGAVPNGASSESNNTFTIRQDRQHALDPSELIWNFRYEIEVAQPRASWDIPSLNTEILNGTIVVKTASFKVDRPITNPDFLIETIAGDLPINLANHITIQSSKTSALAENEEVQLGLIFNIAADISEGEYLGALHVLDGEKAITNPLEIRLLVSMGSSDSVPEGVSIPGPDRIVIDQDNGQLFTIDQAEVVLRDGADFDAFSSRLSELGGVFTGRVPFLPFYQIRFPNIDTPADLDYFIETLQNDEDVLVASREWRSDSRTVPPNDEEYIESDESSWDEHNPSGRKTPWEFTNFLSAWNELYAGIDVSQLDKINIAVVDLGFSNHPDLDIRSSALRLSFSNLVQKATKNFSHGTSVAGIIGAIANNTIGVVGGIWNSNLQLYNDSSINGFASRILSGGTVYTAMAAMQKAVEGGAKIINYSLGTLFKNQDQYKKDNIKWRQFFNLGNHCDPHPEAYCTECAPVAFCTKNTLFVFAAPNPPEEGDPNYPFLANVKYDFPSSLAPDYENIISVTGILAGDFNPIEISDNIFYPFGAGGNVTVAAPSGHWVAKTLRIPPSHTYVEGTGTSFATPMVSALAGLILTKNPNLAPRQIKDVIVGGACAGGKKVSNKLNDIPGVSGFSPINIINAYESLKLADNPDAAMSACVHPVTGDILLPAFAEGDLGTVGDGLLISGTSYAIGFLRSATRFNPDPMPFLSDDAGIITLTVYAEAPVFGYESYIFFGLRGDNCDFVLRTINRRVTELGFPEPDGIFGVFGEIDVTGLLAEFSAQGCIGSASDLYIRQVQVSAFFGGNMRLDAFAIGSGELKVLEYMPLSMLN